MPGALDHSPASIVRTLLVSLSQGVDPPATSGWTIQDTSEPDQPDDTITVYDTAGRKQGRSQIDGETFEIHGLQIRVRAANSVTGWAKARALAIVVDTSVYRNSVTIGASQYLVQHISRTGDVLSLGKETPNSKRSIFTLNALISVRKTN